jgi:hypothetical protein
MIDKDIMENVIKHRGNGFEKDKDHFSITRDVFTARLESFIAGTKKYLEAAIIGEIGNNTFDHNFIYRNMKQKGVYCNFCFYEKYIILSDYGRGIKKSLSQVLPNIQTDFEAIEIAFTKNISGRSPEQRGNGLKFVSKTIQENNWNLFFQSGKGNCFIDRNGIKYTESNILISGCLAIINFDGGK